MKITNSSPLICVNFKVTQHYGGVASLELTRDAPYAGGSYTKQYNGSTKRRVLTLARTSRRWTDLYLKQRRVLTLHIEVAQDDMTRLRDNLKQMVEYTPAAHYISDYVSDYSQ